MNGYRPVLRRRQIRHSRSNHKQRSQPYQLHNPNVSIDQIAKGPAANRKIKVSANSEIQKVAGAICHCIRAGGYPPYVMCTGIDAISQAIKALSVARDYLAGGDYGEEKDIIVTPEMVEDSAKCLLKLRNALPITESELNTELHVKQSSNAFKVAGAIAGNARKGERRIGVTAIGPAAVFRAVEAIAVSGIYLEEDNIDIKFTVKFTKTYVPGKGEMHGLHFTVLAKS